MFDIQMSDKRVIRRHLDQLRSRVSCGEEDTSPSGELLDDSGGPELPPAEPDSSGIDETSSELRSLWCPLTPQQLQQLIQLNLLHQTGMPQTHL